jgi:hypothetical protein
MQTPTVMRGRALPLPLVAFLAAVLVTACVDGLATGPRALPSDPSLAVHILVDDDDGNGNCRKGYTATSVTPGVGADENGNGITCIRRVGGIHNKGPDK